MMNTQSWVKASPPVKSAGPMLRAGLTEVPVSGIPMMCTRVRARPMAMPATVAFSTRRVTARARARAEARQQVCDDAAAVVLEAFGGGGLTDNVFVQCEPVRFQLTNGSRLPIRGINVAIEPLVEFPHLAGDRPLSLVAGGSATWWQTTKPFAIPVDQAGDRALLTRAAVVTFTLEGRTWRTQSGNPPELVLGALPDLYEENR
jgi:hypothetical protein